MNPGSRPAGPPRGWLGRVLVFVGGAAVLIAVAFVLQTPAPLFLALPLLLAPFAAALTAPDETGVGRLTWEGSGSGAEVDVVGKVNFNRPMATRNIDIRWGAIDPLEPRAAPEIVRRRGAIEFHLRLAAPYPCLVPLAVPELTWRDSFGLLEVPIPVEGERLRLDRFPPEVRRIRHARLERTAPSPGEVRSRIVGRTGEFFAVRAAAPGDAARDINWWASARSGRLLTNDFLLERTGDIVLVLDARPTSLGPERDAKLLSVCRAAAWGISEAFLAEKSRVGVGVFSEFLSAIRMGTGRLQRYRIRELLMAPRPSGVAGPPERLAVSMRRFFAPGVTTLFLSPLVDESGALALSYLRRRGFPTIVLSPSPVPLFRPTPRQETPDDRLALRVLSLMRRQRVSEGWKEAPVIDWADYWSLTPLVRFLGSPARWGRRL